MKKLLALIFALALTLCCAFAEEDAALPAVGDTLSGFTVTGIYPYFDSQVVAFEHEKTGAPLLWVANDSTDRAFCVGFRTLVYDDKGIPHVFEHAATSGGEKYPNPNQFEAGVYGTYNTFMNAMTSSTWTAYPCSSLSEEQLLRYVDYYLDGVYNPLLLTEERLVRREAFRYELPSPDAELTVQGTVYSEMLGALTQNRDVYTRAMRLAFPGSAVGSETGGVPGEIEKITQQEMVDFHARYYHPSNSLTVLYGDLDIAPFLELIDGEYLSRYEKQEIDVSDAPYTPLEGYAEEEYAFPISKTDVSQTIMLYTIPLEGMDQLGVEQLNIAMKAMMADGQPLDLLTRERLPSVSISPDISIEGPCPSLTFAVYGAQPEQKDEVLAVIREGIAAAVNDGLDPDLLASAVLGERFSEALRGENTAAYSVALNFINAWSADGDPLAQLAEDTFSKGIEEYLEAGVFDELIEKYLAHPAAESLVVSTGEPGLLEKQDAEKKAALAEKKAAMSEEELEALVAESKALAAWQEENAATVSVAPLTAVDVRSLPEEVVAYAAKDEETDGLRVVSSEVDSDMIRVALYLNASGVAPEQLDAAALAAWMMGMASTEETDTTALNVRVSGVTNGGISAYLTPIRREDGSYQPVLILGFDCFREGLDEAFALTKEILFETAYDPDEIAALCASLAPAYKQGIDPNEHAQRLAMAAFDEGIAYQTRTSTVGVTRTMERVAAMDEAELEAFCAELKAARDELLRKDGMILTVAGSAENIAATTERALSLREGLSDEPVVPADYSALLASQKNVAATYVSGTMYNVEMLPLRESGFDYSGKLMAFANVFDNLVLTPVLRHERSVYTPFTILSEDWVGVMAYRDPNLAKTFDEVYPALSDYVRALSLTQEELDGYVTSAYSELAMPVGPFTGAGTAIDDALRGAENTFDLNLKRMRDLKETTPEDVIAFADLLDKIAADGARVSVGNPQIIERDKAMFDAIDTWLTE